MTNSKNKIQEVGDWILRLRIANDQKPSRLLLLLHGWTGDENSMWIFTPRIPINYLVVSPRGLYPTPLGGYGWREGEINGWSKIDDFNGAIEALLELVNSGSFTEAEVKKFSLLGFSQGAALSYALAVMHPERIDKLAGISGFMPENVNEYLNGELLRGKKVFVAHGRKDELVPIEKARGVIRILKQAGADVIYCEDDVGHKLSSNCFSGLDDYLVSDS